MNDRPQYVDLYRVQEKENIEHCQEQNLLLIERLASSGTVAHLHNSRDPKANMIVWKEPVARLDFDVNGKDKPDVLLAMTRWGVVALSLPRTEEQGGRLNDRLRREEILRAVSDSTLKGDGFSESFAGYMIKPFGCLDSWAYNEGCVRVPEEYAVRIINKTLSGE